MLQQGASLGAIDLARATSAKSQLQDALDAAALGAARTNATTDAEMKVEGDRYLRQNLNLSSDFALTSSTFHIGESGRIIASARLDVTPFIAGWSAPRLWGVRPAAAAVVAALVVLGAILPVIPWSV